MGVISDAFVTPISKYFTGAYNGDLGVVFASCSDVNIQNDVFLQGNVDLSSCGKSGYFCPIRVKFLHFGVILAPKY